MEAITSFSWLKNKAHTGCNIDVSLMNIVEHCHNEVKLEGLVDMREDVHCGYIRRKGVQETRDRPAQYIIHVDICWKRQRGMR